MFYLVSIPFRNENRFGVTCLYDLSYPPLTTTHGHASCKNDFWVDKCVSLVCYRPAPADRLVLGTFRRRGGPFEEAQVRDQVAGLNPHSSSSPKPPKQAHIWPISGAPLQNWVKKSIKTDVQLQSLKPFKPDSHRHGIGQDGPTKVN